MRNFRQFSFTTIVLSLCCASFVSAYSGGSGTPTDPYLISTPSDLNSLGVATTDWNKNFKLTDDINMSDYTGTQYKIIGNSTTAFTGTFDGNGYSIRNLTYITTASVNYVGLFGWTNNATIKNLGVENVNLSTVGWYAGGLVGIQFNGTISNCYSTGSVTTSIWTGGLVGYQSGGTIMNSYSTVSVSSSFYAGGLVGYQTGTIMNCYSTGSVTFSASSSIGSCGGLVGCLDSGTIIHSCSTGSVVSTSVSVNSSYAGGLVGWQQGISTITDSYSTSSVSSTSNNGVSSSGGLVGYQADGIIKNCHSTGLVTSYSYSTSGSYAGGLVGRGSTIACCYSTGSVSSTSVYYYSYAGGLVGEGRYNTTNCYSTGSVASSSSHSYSYAGGLVGYQFSASTSKIEKCYSTGQVSGTGSNFYRGGLLGDMGGINLTFSACFWDTQTGGTTDGVGGVDPDPNGVTGKTTAEMKTLSTFTSAGWDFTNETANGTNDYWRMCTDGITYPRLNWQSPDGDFMCPDDVSFVDFAYFAARWLMAGCSSSNNFCGGADMDFSGTVDMQDLALVSDNWLEGI